ncbi:MAG: 1-deoxy-D-xylulose-5-phosphate synthase, partial [Bacteroidetes bacterium]|nr:1-deoxy-D-xylulose-5-phosphate synthase [Bacteroidota bacterium]
FAKEAVERLMAENITAEHIDMRFIKPLDEDCLHRIFKTFSRIITVEDGVISGGFGSAILEFMCEHGFSANVRRLGVPDRFIEQGTQQELYNECGFDADGIYEAVKALVMPRILTKAG